MKIAYLQIRNLVWRQLAICFAVVFAGIGTYLILHSLAAAPPTTLYVNPQGNDNNPGSDQQPFKTIGRAAAAAGSGDTVLVQSGVYKEEVDLKPNDSNVVFRGTGPTQPVIDGEYQRDYGFKSVGVNGYTINNFEITRQNVAGVYSYGSNFGSLVSNNTIINNTLHHIGSQTEVHANGIRIGWSQGDLIQHNTIHDIGPGGESMGIWLLQSRDTRVDGNSVYLVRKEGVRDWQGLDNTISNNRFFLNWVGLALNTSAGTIATNNYIYQNTEGIDAKHVSYSLVTDLWKLSDPHWSKIWHNTVYDSSEANIWYAQSDQPLDYLDVRDNLFVGGGAFHIRDAPELRGPHVIVDGNAYAYPTANNRPTAIYKQGFSTLPAAITDWDTYRNQLGWDKQGKLLDPQLINPDGGNLDYSQTSPAAAGSLDLGDALGSQLGARGLPPAPVTWTTYPMKPIDSSSKGSWSTQNHLADSADGNQYTYWLTNTGENEYVTFDLGRPEPFNYFVLDIFQHLDKRNPHGYRFEVSADGTQWQTILEGTNPDSEGSSYKYELAKTTTARFIRYTMKDTFCDSYAPRVNCGANFVLSDLRVGLLQNQSDIPSAPLLTGDLNQDGHVNINDVSIFLKSYKKTRNQAGYSAAADLNHDGVVNIYDLSLLLNGYGK